MRTFEKLYPFISGVTAAAIGGYLLLVLDYDIVGDTPRLLSSLLSFSGVIVGFLSTSLAILFALSDRPYLKAVVRSGAFERLINFIGWSIAHWVSLTILCLFTLYLHEYVAPTTLSYLFLACIFFLSTGFFSFERAIRLIIKLLRKQVQEEK